LYSPIHQLQRPAVDDEYDLQTTEQQPVDEVLQELAQWEMSGSMRQSIAHFAKGAS